jgi:hypothetical protein
LIGPPMSSNKKIPFIPPHLVEWLEGLFSDQLPSDVSVSHREIDAKIGEQRVIRKLRAESEKQNKPTKE